MSEAPAEPQSHASPLRVVFVGVALLGVLGASLFLARPRTTEIDAEALMDELFDGRPAAWSEMEGPEGVLLPTGEKVVTYRREGAVVEEVTIMLVPEKRATKVLREQFQQLKFDSGGKGGRGGRGGGRGGSRGGRGGGEGGWGDDKDKPKLQDISAFDWNGFGAVHARVRHGGGSPEDDKPFYEVSRVNLSRGNDCVIAYLRYREGHVGSLSMARAYVQGL